MKKEKLITKRLENKFSQNHLAHLMCMEQSTYSRRESGETKISSQEWKKLADLLNCKIEDIFEPDRPSTIKIDNINANLNNNYYNIPKSVLENLQDFIEYLREDNNRLKKRFLDNSGNN